MSTINENHKRVRIIRCDDDLKLAQCIRDVTGRFLSDAVVITKNVTGGILLLNESSITPGQWQRITEQMNEQLEWELV